MKKILLLPLVLAFVSCGVMGKQTVSELPASKKVIEVDGTKNELYVKANSWMVENFKSAKSVIQFSDKESGTVMGKYFLAPIANANEYGPSQNAFAIIKILVKEDAAKIEITPDKVNYMKGNMFNLYNEEEAKSSIDGLLVSFEEYMKENNSDW